MLHIVNKSPLERNALDSCLAAAQPGAAVLLIEDGVYAATRGTAAEGKLRAASAHVEIYVLAPDLEAEARRRVGCLDDRRYGRITRINQRRRASRLTERNSRISPADARDIRPMLAAAPVLEVPHRVWHAISRAIDDPSPRRRAGLEFLRIRAVRFAESVRHLSASLDRLPRRHDDRPALRQRLRRRRAQLTRVLRVIDACTTLPSLRLGRRPERSPVFLEVA